MGKFQDFLKNIPTKGYELLDQLEHDKMGTFQVSDESCTSVGLLDQIETLYMTATEKTPTFDEIDVENPSLSQSYAVVRALREILLKLLRKYEFEQSGEYFIDETSETIEEVIMGFENEYSFNRMLTVFMGCVNPRSFCDCARNQITETIIARLVYPSTFEIAGWKRLIPVREIFKKLKIKLDEYKLFYHPVDHPVQKYEQYAENTTIKLEDSPELSVTSGFETGTIVDFEKPKENIRYTGTVIGTNGENYKIRVGRDDVIEIPRKRITFDIYNQMRNNPNLKRFKNILEQKSVKISDDFMLYAKGFVLEFRSKDEMNKIAAETPETLVETSDQIDPTRITVGDIAPGMNIGANANVTQIFNTIIGNEVSGSGQMNANINIE